MTKQRCIGNPPNWPRAALALAVVLLAAGPTLAQPVIDDADGLVAAAAEGGTFLLSAGDFVLTETLVIARDLELRGETTNATAIDVLAAPLGIRVEGGATVRFEALSIGYESEVPGDVVWVHDARLDLVDVRIGFGRGGPSDDPARPFGVGTGLVLTGSAHVTVTGGGLGRNQLAGAEAYGTAVLELIDTVVVDNDTGVYVDGEAQVRIRGTEARGQTQNALAGVGASRIDVADSTFEANGGYDTEAEVYHSAVRVDGTAHLSMQGDVLRANVGGAIEITGDATVELDGVTITETGSWAHIFAIDGARLTVRGGRFVDNEGALYAGGSARVVVHGSELAGGDTDGVLLDGRADLELRDSVVRDHGEFGVLIAGDARAIITGTTVEGNRSGVVMDDAGHATLSDNDVHRNERSGVAFLLASTGDVVDNRLDGNGWNGVVVADDAQAHVTGNVLDGNVERGILYDGRATGRVDGNTVRASPAGIAVWRAAAPQIGTNTFADVDVDVEDLR